MANIKIEQLGGAISEILNFYHEDVVEKVDAVGEKAIKELVELTAIKAPRQSGDFRLSLTYKKVPRKSGTGSVFIWGAAAPHHRITHLLVHGHATVNGGRVKGHPFLEESMAEVEPKYLKDLEEALQNDK